MKRRAFLASLATAPLFIRRAFGDASPGDARPPAAARSRPSTGAPPPATTGARPTLVLVVPRDVGQRWERGAAFGDFLEHASDRELAPLALVDVVCAPAADYGVPGDPLALLVGPAGTRVWPARATVGVALVRNLVSEVAPLRGADVASLAAAARQRYVKKAPRGARWGRTTMCGAEYEEGPADAVDCGMGSIGEPSRRFLAFYAKLR